MLYSETMERKSHPVGRDGVKAYGNRCGTSNRANPVVVISSHVSEVDEAGGRGDFSRMDL